MSGRRELLWLAGGIVLALALRTGYAIHAYRTFEPSLPREKAFDPESYDTMSERLLATHRLSDEEGRLITEREPLYPLMLAGVHRILGSSLWVAIGLNIAIGALTCLLIYGIALVLWRDPWIARIAFLIACVFPEWIYYDAFLYREPICTLLLAAWAYLWFDRERREPRLNFLLMGLCFGAISLIRSPMIPLGAAFCALAARRLPARSWVRTIGIFCLCAALCQAPWILRNRRILGHFVAGASMGGSVMYLSLVYNYANPEIPFEAPFSRADSVIQAAAAKGLSLAQAEPMFYAACWDIFVHRPGLFWSAFVHKAVKLWRPYPNAGWQYGYSLGLLKIVGILSNGLLPALGIAGFVLTLRRRRSTDFLILIPSVMTLVYALFWAVTRYHTPLMMAFMPPAALALRESFRFVHTDKSAS